MPRSFNAAAMARHVVAPLACISSTTGLCNYVGEDFQMIRLPVVDVDKDPYWSEAFCKLNYSITVSIFRLFVFASNNASKIMIGK